MVGGYTIIDLKGAALSSAYVIVEGVYDKIEGSRKPLLIKNFRISNIERTPFYAYPSFVGNSIFLFMDYIGGAIGRIVVTENDGVAYDKAVITQPENTAEISDDFPTASM